MPLRSRKPHVISNFVTTLDGVVSLSEKGHASGGDISGFSAEDRAVMGLLRAVVDVIIVGSGTLDVDRRHVWTAERVYPPLAADYRRLRRALRKDASPLMVVVSGSGRIDLSLPLFTSGEMRSLIVTSVAGARRLRMQKASGYVEIRCTRRRGDQRAIHTQPGAARESRKTDPGRGRTAADRGFLRGWPARRAVPDARAASRRPRGGRSPPQPRHGPQVRAAKSVMGKAHRPAAKRQPSFPALRVHLKIPTL